MKSKTYYNLAEAANFIMVVLLYISVVEVWDVMYKVPFNFVLPVGTFLMLIFSLLLRIVFGKMNSFMNNIVVYALLHAIPVAAIIFVPVEPLYKMALAFVFFIIFLTNMRSYYKAKGQGFEYISIILVVIPALLYLIADVLSLRLTMFVFFIVGVAYVILYYFRLFFSNAHLLSIERKNNEKMPVEDMLKNDSKLAIPFIVISFAIMVVAKIEKLDTWALFLYEKFTGVLRIVFWKFFTFVEMVFNYLFGGTEDDIVYVQDLMEEESPAANPIFNIISAVVFVILALALLFLFVKAI
ncbi:MAG: hypothetical protein J6P37_09360, partial [Lachnospiraceae bacterium]|nr:hypothetical protein [Lachnospiraceae bacterium]